MKKIKSTPWLIGLLQTTAFLIYSAGVGTLMLNGNRWFGPINTAPLLGLMLFLSLFVFSAIVCASIMLAYPFYLFWEKKDFRTAFKIVSFSSLWLFLFIIFTMAILLLSK